jgi:signal transduction histidine kinase
MLDAVPVDELKDYSKILTGLASHLIDEIQAQRDIFSAEKGELRVKFAEMNTNEILTSTVHLYSQHPVAMGKGIRYKSGDRDETVNSDERLVRRVLGNMVKNALEAIDEGEYISLWGRQCFKHYVFCVHNKQFMAPLVQLQVFNRSFSTKGIGRGLGTYSIKLLTEKYLHGRAGFTSNKEHGTIFYAIIPLDKK